MKTISLNGIFGWEITAQNFKSKIKEDSKEKLRILLNSPGGDPYEAFEMYNIVKAYKGEVEIIIGAMAASAASYFAMSVPLEKRKGFKNSSAMIHEAQAGARGKAKDLKSLASVMEGVNNILAEAYVEGMKGEKEDILKKMDATHYMTGWEQLVENNFISDIVDAKDIEIPDEPESESMMVMFLSALEKSPDINNIKAIVDIANSKIEMSMYNKIAALLPEKKESTPIEKPVEDIIKTEEKMNLQEFLKANPEAEAEYKSALLSAEEKGKSEAVNLDRTRIKNILELSGVKLSDSAIKALGDGIDDRDFAVEELKRQKDIRATGDKNIFASLASKQMPNEQSPADVPKEINYDEFDKKIEASAEKHAKIGRLI